MNRKKGMEKRKIMERNERIERERIAIISFRTQTCGTND